MVVSIQQAAIGGDHGAKAFFPRAADEGTQQWVQHGLAHQMKIEVVDLPHKSIGKPLKLRLGQLLGSSLGAMAKGAFEVADIGNFQKSLVDDFHGCSFRLTIISFIYYSTKAPCRQRGRALDFIGSPVPDFQKEGK